MKRFFVTTLAIVISCNLHAQNTANETAPVSNAEPAKEAPAVSKAEKMKKLNLSEEQKMKLVEINNVNRRAKTAIESDSSLSAEQKQQKIKELKNAQTEKLKSILTSEQFEQLKTMRKEEE